MAIEGDEQVLPTEGFDHFVEDTPQEVAEYEDQINDEQPLNRDDPNYKEPVDGVMEKPNADGDDSTDINSDSGTSADADADLSTDNADTTADNATADQQSDQNDANNKQGDDTPLSKKEKFERYSRSVQRKINKEVKRRAILEAENQALQERLARIEQKLHSDEVQSEASVLENRIRNATAIKRQLLEDAEYDKVAEVDNDIMEMTLRKRELETAARAAQQHARGMPPPVQPGQVPPVLDPQTQQPYAPPVQQPYAPPVQQPYAPQQYAEDPYGQQAQVPEIQTRWIQSNPRFGKDQAYTDYVNKTYDAMLEEGYDPESPSMYEELNRRTGTTLPGFSQQQQNSQTSMSTNQQPTQQQQQVHTTQQPRRQRPPSAPPPAQGSATQTRSSETTITEADKANMRSWGLDPNDKAVRQEWLNNKTSKRA